MSEPHELRAVLFDVDFTLARPGPELGPEGYVRAGERHGLTLDSARYEAARDAALVDLRRHPELEHDDEIWFRFTERIVRGMGGDADSAYACAVEITRGWERHENFELYDDVPDSLASLRAAGLRIGLVSNSSRDVREFALHHGLDVDAGISSFHHGRTKPHASIFRAVLDLLERRAGRGGDGRGHHRRRHRRRARARHAGDPARPRGHEARTTSLGSRR